MKPMERMGMMKDRRAAGEEGVPLPVGGALGAVVYWALIALNGEHVQLDGAGHDSRPRGFVKPFGSRGSADAAGGLAICALCASMEPM
jgi:hypothetical protein